MAQVTITQLPAAGALDGTELVPVVQNGVTVHTTTGDIASQPVQQQTFITVDQETSLPNSRYMAVDDGLALADGGAESFLKLSMTLMFISFNIRTSWCAMHRRREYPIRIPATLRNFFNSL